jgi:mRNA-degrading endonuclease RelE of RelBE toxin-antitoxin system
MIFVETSVFSRQRREYLDDEQFRALQNALLDRPRSGDRIAGTGGLRKLRWSAEGRGKRGGIRLIYVYIESREVMLLLMLYPKNVQDDLSMEQKRSLAEVVKAELQQAGGP